MSRIIDPNAPSKINGLDFLIDTMRVIANYRKQYLDLRAMLQNDGVQEPLTTIEINRIHAAMEAVAENLLEFILYGADNDARSNDKSQAPAARIETGTQKPA